MMSPPVITKVGRGKICDWSFSPDGKTLAVTFRQKQVILLHAPSLSAFNQNLGPNKTGPILSHAR